MTDLVFLKALRDKLKGGNTRSIHLNALPGNFASRLDVAQLNQIAPRTAEKFLDLLLSKASFEFKVSFDEIDFNNLSVEEQKRFGILSKRLNSLYIDNEDSFKDHGLKTFGFGYPLIIKRSKLDPTKLIKAPLFIWPLEILKSYNKVNSWSILRNKIRNQQGRIVDEEIHSVGLNEVLISFIKNDEDISIQQINEELLEDAVIDEKELIDTCLEVLRSLNALESRSGTDLLERFHEPLEMTRDAKHFDAVSGNKAWIHFGGVFGLFRTQKESIISDIDRLIERFNSFEFENNTISGISGTVFSAINTDPSQQELLSTLTSEPKKIIQGPPGTGKSQSLTALITNALANHLKCLVVCEKKTALDVIRQNLKRENEQLGLLAAVIEDINKDRDGIVNSVRDRHNHNGSFPYFNQRVYLDSKENVELSARSINGQHAELAKEIYQGKNWTNLVGEYLALEEKSKANVFKNQLDYKSFEFINNQNELADILKVLGTGKQLYTAVKDLGHPLSNLHDHVLELSNIAEIQITIEKYLIEQNKISQEIIANINKHSDEINNWIGNTVDNFPGYLTKEIQPYHAYLLGNPLREQRKLPDVFVLEKLAQDTILRLQELASFIDHLLFHYKSWLDEHYHSYYQSVKSSVEGYLSFVDDNTTLYGRVFLNNKPFNSFKINFLSKFSKKYKTIKENRIVLMEKIPEVKKAHAFHDYFQHSYVPLEPVDDLEVFVEDIRKLNDDANAWYAGVPTIIDAYWHSTSSGKLHAQYVEGGDNVLQLEKHYNQCKKEIRQKYGLLTSDNDLSSVHDIKKDVGKSIALLGNVIEQFNSFRAGYRVIQLGRSILCEKIDEMSTGISSTNVLSYQIPAVESLPAAKDLLHNINDRCLLIQNHLSELREYYYWKTFFKGQPALYRTVLLACVESGSDDWQSDFKRWYLHWLLASHENQNLPKADGKHLEFKNFKSQFKDIQINYINNHWRSMQVDAVRTLQRTGIGIPGLYNKRGTRGEKRNSLRKIVQTSFDVFTSFFPVVMVSPSVCSSILPMKEGMFDIIIFDEASQLRLEDTFPSLLRGKIKIISGDSQQMPPSAYFQGGASVLNPGEQDEDENETNDEVDAPADQRKLANQSIALAESESLLVYAENCNYRQSYLKIHYRSQHPFLIDFSNHAFYGKRLIPMPAQEDYRPIKVIEVNGVYEESVNRDEAKKVIDILLYEIKPMADGRYPSVGIATFNLYQRNLILEEITKARQASTENDQKINSLGTDLFVKNLENIQGDERDVIIISTTFGKKADGSFSQKFGPILQSNGHKLLNVIVTRAKHQIFLCTSIPRTSVGGYLPLLRHKGNTGRGVFYAYLAYAISVAEGNHEIRKSILEELYENCEAKEFDIQSTAPGSESPFEEEVYGRLVKEIGQTRVEQQYKIGGFRVDMVIRSDKTGLPLIALECDGAKYHTSNEAYAWDMFRQEQLERTGLIFYRIWSTNWWIAPENELKKLIAFVTAKDYEEKNQPVQMILPPAESLHETADVIEVTLETFNTTIPKKEISESIPDQEISDEESTRTQSNEKVSSSLAWNNPDLPILLGTKYKDKFHLEETDVKELDKLEPWLNNFTSNEFCLGAAIQLYLPVVKRVNEYLQSKDSSLELEIKNIKYLLSPGHNNVSYGSMYYGSIEYVRQRMHSMIFKYCENKVRHEYGHKRKVNLDGPFYNAKADELFREKILPTIVESLDSFVASIPVPDNATEILLNAQNTSRWKLSFEKITTTFSGDAKQFYKAICYLGAQNEKNPNVEHVFFEGSKFIASVDSRVSLQLYLHYIYADLLSEKIDNRQLNRSLQKGLFKSGW